MVAYFTVNEEDRDRNPENTQNTSVAGSSYELVIRNGAENKGSSPFRGSNRLINMPPWWNW